MDNIRNLPWVRITAEGIAIIVSILIAFAIDAWWDERKEEQEAHRALTAIKAELHENIELIDRELAYRNASNAYIQEILDASGGDSAVTIERAGHSYRRSSMVWSCGLSVGRTG